MKKIYNYLQQLKILFLLNTPLKFVVSRILNDDEKFKLVSKIEKTLIAKVKIGEEKFTIASSRADDHFPWIVLGQFKFWEKLPIQNFIHAVQKDSVVIDVGAYLGVYTLLACRAGASKVIAIEPNSALIPWLHTNICLNGMQDNVIVEGSGLSNLPGSENLLTPINRVSSSGAHLIDSNLTIDPTQWKISENISLTTIDLLAKKHSLSRIDVIKIDAEGYELKIIEGASKVLEKFYPMIQVELLNFAQFESFNKLMAQFGYLDCTPLDGVFPQSTDLNSSSKVATNFQFLHRA